MLVYAIALFAIAAVIGLYLISRVFGGRLPPLPAAALHGLFAASGLLILLYAAFVAPGAPMPIVVAAILLLVAALGGFVLVSYHLRGQVPPKPLAGIHALAAVAGFLALCGSVFGLI
jgi:hypothetical protein